MLTKAQSKYIRALADPEGRRAGGAFVVEGPKLVEEWLRHASQDVTDIYATPKGRTMLPALFPGNTALHLLPDDGLKGVSQLQTPPVILAVCRLPLPAAPLLSGWTLACEALQDPGNLGTILRIADWYGVPQVVCSQGSADFYNPKVVQAGMGAHLRVGMHSMNLISFLQKTTLPVFAATLSGENLHAISPQKEGILLIGNESRGLSPEVLSFATRQLTIPRRGGAESLNAAVAAGILCDRLLA